MLSRRHILNGFLATVALSPTLNACATGPASNRDQTQPLAEPIAFSEWQDSDAGYAFYPTDKLDIQVPSAPELNRQATVGQDGRISLPMAGQVMAAHKSVPQLEADIAKAYAPYLRNPSVNVLPTDTPMRVIVGGEVKGGGWIDMSGDMDALQAVMAAGGFTPAARRKEVVIIRRGPSGKAMRRVINLQNVIDGRGGELFAIRRNDIIFVPRSNIAEAGVWVQQHVNDLIPSGIMTYLLYNSN
ncbi:MAG: sugar transporter [Asticcacaulis sp. 32-58-5]|nr:MAG: sugar transporter [Asticcacaulis sp. 32-58-5]